MGSKQPKGKPVQKNQLSTTLQSTLNCPSCNQSFNAGTPLKLFKDHVTECLGLSEDSNPLQMHQNFALHQQLQLQQNQMKQQHVLQNYIYEKIPVDDEKIKFKWYKVPCYEGNVNVNMHPEQVAKLPFQAKLQWFRGNLQKFRIPWQNGADFMKIDKTNTLISSYIEAKKVNMHKEIKIDFIGQKVNDAGGLLRQWIHLIIKELFDDSIGIFHPANTSQIMYKLKWDEDVDEQFSRQLLYLFGIILGKAIFQKIPILCYLDHTILRQLCGGRPTLYDIHGFDSGLYSSWKFVEENDIEGLDLTFSVTKQKTDSTVQEIELIEGGSEIIVDESNKRMYVNSCVQLYSVLAVNRSLEFIKTTLHKIVPEKLLSVFEPFEMEMILNGVPFIDPKDWKENTDYKGEYNKNHKVIQWFWKKVMTFDQQQLAQLLHFSTGSSRAPIHGFKKLQSNRGNYAKFLIQSTAFSKKNPFPKGHTCFNRLQLPIYPSEQMLDTYLTAIVKTNLDGVFGLD